MRLPISEISAILGTPLLPPGPHVPPGGEAEGYSIDSRLVTSGDLFFAIRGPHFDGHDFIGAALQGGAVAAVARAGSSALAPCPDPRAAR